jgi:peptidoglycan/xylan/chitin deacetylase (PgdA/CDA1 family)
MPDHSKESEVSSRRMNHRPRKLHLLRLLPNAWVTTSGPRRQRTLYLSFDDGPHPLHTPPLLDLLAEHGVRATFFLIGRNAEAHPDLARRIVAEGHALGNHSYSHPHFERLALPEQLDEVARTDRILGAFDGQPSHSFRPPRGVLPRPMLLHFMRRRRPIAYWSYDSLDYSRRPAAELVAFAQRDPPHAGDIILMHDDNDIALHVLRVMLPAWKAQGFGFDAMPPDMPAAN